MRITETLLYGDSSLDDKSNALILNTIIDFLLVTKRFDVNLFKLNMAVLQNILVKFIVLFFIIIVIIIYSEAYQVDL